MIRNPFKKKNTNTNNEISAAIGLALHLYFKETEKEITPTCKQIYSKWSDKHYNMSKIPVKINKKLI